MEYIRKNGESDLVCREKNGVAFFQFEGFSRLPWITHAFSTRIGGVSTGPYASMNLSFTKGEAYETVAENYRRFSGAVGFPWKDAVLSWQTHTTNIRRVTREDMGKGVIKDRDYKGIDGLITDIPGIPLMTFYADCVPLYLIDPVHQAIGLSHSGWRGTVNRMGECTLRKMKEAFQTQPQDVLAAIGPSICGDCFEVGPEVIAEFEKEFGKEFTGKVSKAGEKDRSFLDLWKVNRKILLQAGVLPQNIHVTNVCTRCNPELLYSHRRMGNLRGNLAAVLMINSSEAKEDKA